MCGPLSVLYMMIVLSEAELVDKVEQLADILVVVDHRVVVPRLPPSRLPDALGLGVSKRVHMCRVHPDEERLACGVLPLDEVLRRRCGLVVDRLHALLRERASVLDPLLAHAPPAWLVGRIVLVRRPRVDHAARPEPLPVLREVLLGWVVRPPRFHLRVQVVEVSVELVEAVRGGKVFVQVAEMILAELPRRVAEWLEQLGDRRILCLQADR